MSDLAPLHNQPALAAIRRHEAGWFWPMVATFDTAFYADSARGGGPLRDAEGAQRAAGIRRYGFHGLAHRYMVERYQALRPQVERPRLITLQLGNGCSATASRWPAARHIDGFYAA